MATMNTGVLLCGKNTFKVGATAETATMVADIETFSVEFTYKEIAWNPHDTNGVTRRIVVLTDVKVTMNGKRNIGDTGNDFVADMAGQTGRDCEGYIEVLMPDGKLIKLENAIYQVKNIGTGAATDAAPLEAEIYSNGSIDITKNTAATE